MVTIFIVTILAVLVFYGSGPLVGTVSKARCISNLRSLHTAFAGFVQDHSLWPQVPDEAYEDGDNAEEYWLSQMDPYLDTRKVWLCPVLERGRITSPSGKPLKMHYIPTRFDANRISPYRWSTQPWLVEMGNAHNSGALILFPDGSVRGLKEILKR